METAGYIWGFFMLYEFCIHFKEMAAILFN